MRVLPMTGRAAVVAAGAIHGAAAWLAYASVEYGFATLVTRFLPSHCGTARYDAAFAWTLAAGYPLMGASIGGAAALLLIAVPGRASLGPSGALAIGLLSLACPIVLPEAFRFGANATGLALGTIGVGAAGAALAALRRPSLTPALGALSNPWTVALFTQGLLWLRVRHALFGDPVPVRYGLIVGWVLVVAAAAAAVALVRRRSRRRRDEATTTTAGRVLAAPGAVFASVAGLAGLAEIGFFAEPASVPRTPNVIVVVMDTVRADHLSLYGYERETSPNLEALARDSTIYTRAFSGSDYTLPSIGSLFTGRLPTSHGAHAEDPRLNAGHAVGEMALSDRMLTLTENLASVGYRTLAVVANHGLLSPRYNFDQGFEQYLLPYPGCAPSSPARFWRPLAARLAPSVFLWSPEGAFSTAAEVNQEVYEAIEPDEAPGRPFMLFVNYMDAHEPYQPPPPYDRRFPGRIPSFGDDDYDRLERSVSRRQARVPDPVRRHLISQYDGGIAFIDAQIGKLVDHLKAMGLYDDSLIVVTSDHGESFGERDLMGHNVSVYQDQIHVPLVIKYPRRRAVGVEDAPVSAVDVMPTALDLLAIPGPEDVDGRSLLDPPLDPDRLIVAESFPHPTLMDVDARFHRVERAVVEWPHKLIVATDGRRERYRLDVDPAERKNLHAAGDPVSARLAARLESWLADAVVEAGEAPVLDDEMRERLRSLGYVR